MARWKTRALGGSHAFESALLRNDDERVGVASVTVRDILQEE